MGTFETAMAFVFEWEGGFVDHPLDPGGPTNMGVSLRWLRDVGLAGDIDRDGDVDADDVRSLTPERVEKLFKDRFWDPQGLDELPRSPAIAHFDCSVNTGPGRAGRIMQEVCNFHPGGVLDVDGVVGPKTRARVREICDTEPAERVFASRLLAGRKRFYDALAARPVVRTVHGRPVETYPYRTFHRGWLNRVSALAEHLELKTGEA